MRNRIPNNVTRKWFRVPIMPERQRAYARIAEFIAELDTTAHTAEQPDMARRSAETLACCAMSRNQSPVARMVEEAWFAAIKGSSLDRPPLSRNAYAVAKAGE